jgi:hypothetical protein
MVEGNKFISEKKGLTIQLSQGQDRQPLSPEKAHPPAVRA